MKKVVALVLALMMIVCLTACGHKENTDGLPNPMKEMKSLAELSDAAKCAMIKPEGVEVTNEAFYLIEGNPQVAEYQFTVDGKECVLRFANAGVDTDICGIYGENGTLFAEDENENHYIQNDDLQIQRWFTMDGQYVFMVKDGGEWDWEQFNAIQSQFAGMEPISWNSDVPFADYMALVGNYADEAQNITTVSMKDDHVRIDVAVMGESGSRLLWEMEAVLDGSKLVYEKEEISEYVYDDNGTASSNDLPEGGAGYIEIKDDGSLSFAGAYSAQLQALVMQPTDIAG